MWSATTQGFYFGTGFDPDLRPVRALASTFVSGYEHQFISSPLALLSIGSIRWSLGKVNLDDLRLAMHEASELCEINLPVACITIIFPSRCTPFTSADPLSQTRMDLKRIYFLSRRCEEVLAMFLGDNICLHPGHSVEISFLLWTLIVRPRFRASKPQLYKQSQVRLEGSNLCDRKTTVPTIFLKPTVYETEEVLGHAGPWLSLNGRTPHSLTKDSPSTLFVDHMRLLVWVMSSYELPRKPIRICISLPFYRAALEGTASSSLFSTILLKSLFAFARLCHDSLLAPTVNAVAIQKRRFSGLSSTFIQPRRPRLLDTTTAQGGDGHVADMLPDERSSCPSPGTTDATASGDKAGSQFRNERGGILVATPSAKLHGARTPFLIPTFQCIVKTSHRLPTSPATPARYGGSFPRISLRARATSQQSLTTRFDEQTQNCACHEQARTTSERAMHIQISWGSKTAKLARNLSPPQSSLWQGEDQHQHNTDLPYNASALAVDRAETSEMRAGGIPKTESDACGTEPPTEQHTLHSSSRRHIKRATDAAAALRQALLDPANTAMDGKAKSAHQRGRSSALHISQ
ncbi:uncharacterized protein MYCFIDRAFT_170054 [Pseudocercospora fijiensis CIRAD86]|uniref:Uncharacterized protein n=1 Tax=Pseudocercospora fijiensis (strain CIRAD86) TaxID=383855 RepID=N1Q9G5_PSEFD|nr:uncharacterized protein MYCFIDRAFT_170054 [Pseudocercospora fijiensis CIRAD86]EME88436.1 hypothetical protein MYCFIDRAFT_170054 [Pseudocercospora fijiensis CIRAD86]